MNIVAIVLPLPNPCDPRQHEACCPLCKQPDLTYRKSVAQQNNLKCSTNCSSILYSSMLPSGRLKSHDTNVDYIFLDPKDRFYNASQDLLTCNSDDDLLDDNDGNHV